MSYLAAPRRRVTVEEVAGLQDLDPAVPEGIIYHVGFLHRDQHQ